MKKYLIVTTFSSCFSRSRFGSSRANQIDFSYISEVSWGPKKNSLLTDLMKAKTFIAPATGTTRVYNCRTGKKQKVYFSGGSSRQLNVPASDSTEATENSISGKKKAYSFMFLPAAFTVWCYREGRFSPLVTRLAQFAANPNQYSEVDDDLFDLTQEQDIALLW